MMCHIDKASSGAKNHSLASMNRACRCFRAVAIGSILLSFTGGTLIFVLPVSDLVGFVISVFSFVVCWIGIVAVLLAWRIDCLLVRRFTTSRTAPVWPEQVVRSGQPVCEVEGVSHG